MSCGNVIQPPLFTLPPFITVTNPPPETLGNPGDILIRGEGGLGTAAYFQWIPGSNIFRAKGTVGAEVNTGQVLRLDSEGRYIPYATSPLPSPAPKPVGIAISSATTGEVELLREGEHQGGWTFQPNATLWVGADSYPTPIVPTWGLIVECGYSIKNELIRFEAEAPIVGA